jgi:hypothetical protein
MEPVIGNLVEHLTAVTQGKAGKIDLAISIPLGSSIQILLGLIPLAVFSMLLHAIHSPIPMLFLPYDPILNAILWISSVLVWIVSSDNRFGKGHPESSFATCMILTIGRMAGRQFTRPLLHRLWRGDVCCPSQREVVSRLAICHLRAVESEKADKSRLT